MLQGSHYIVVMDQHLFTHAYTTRGLEIMNRMPTCLDRDSNRVSAGAIFMLIVSGICMKS